MSKIRSMVAAGVLAFTGSTTAAVAYPIDCAILLCLAGGFPASAECSAAKAEMIRRITPWPVEPPLQLWNCPMGMSASTLRDINALLIATNQPQMSFPTPGTDGLTPDVRRYRDAIEIYHIRSYYIHRSRDDEYTVDNTERGEYDAVTGDFRWVRGSYEHGPAWLADAVNGRRIDITECRRWGGRDSDTCREWVVVRQENRAQGRLGQFGALRGVAIRTMDHEGNYQHEWVQY